MKNFLSSVFVWAVCALAICNAGTLDKLAAQSKYDARPAINTLRVASNVADGETVTIGAAVFEADTATSPGAITAGNIRVDCSSGVTPTIFCTSLEAAINGANVLGFTYRATKISAGEVLIYNTQNGASAIACSETLAGTNNAWAAATTFGGANVPALPRTVLVFSRVITATETALNAYHYVLPFTPAAASVHFRTGAGVPIVFDGTTTIVGNRVTITATGAAHPAAGDVAYITASN